MKPIQCAKCPLLASRMVPPWKPKKENKNVIMLLGEAPSTRFPENSAPFTDRDGKITTMLLKRLQAYYHTLENGVKRWFDIETYMSYVVRCCTDDTPKKEIINLCRTHLDADIIRYKPRIVITFGATATQALAQTRAKFNDIRGTFLPATINAGNEIINYKIFPTYSPKALLAQPGLFNEALRELQRAFAYSENIEFRRLTENELRTSYRFPRTIDEVRILCDEIIGHCNDGYSPETHFISVDTETSMLEMYDPASKIIMISFAWAERKAAAILLDHPKGWWTPEQLEQVMFHVKRVLASRKPKVLHNYKFDNQVIEHRYGWELNNVVWDTMGAEHLLEEDKKGSYGLKALTRVRLPLYADYDDKVSELREQHGGGTRAEEAKRFRKATQHYKEAYAEYSKALEVYKDTFAEYQRLLDKWETKRATERKRAFEARRCKAPKEKRCMQKSAYGKKPTKPREPKAPKKPERQEPFDYTMIPLRDLELYAAIDADVTRQHVLHQNKRFIAEFNADKQICIRYRIPAPLPCKRLMVKHVIPTSKTLACMEFTGFPVDLQYLEDLDSKLKNVAQETEEQLYELADGKFIINNPAAIARVMFDSGFYENGKKVTVPLTDSIRRTTKGQISSDEKALVYVANTYKYAFPKIVLKYRKACKARDPFLNNVRDHALIYKRLHSTFWLVGTGTGRLSSSAPNLQNIPKKLAGFNIKKVFVPPEGNVLVNSDARGAEIRIFAAYSRDKKLITAINDGLDTHSFFTANVFREKYEEVERARDVVDQYYASKKTLFTDIIGWAEALVHKRTNCKRVVFGTLYGAAAKKIAETAGIPIVEAQEVIDLMFRLFPSIPAYIDSTQREVQLFHWVATKTGRKRRFPIADVRMFRSRCYRQAVNFKIQSTSSDIVLWVMNQIFPVITKDLKGQFHATVHDSIVMSVPEKYIAQVKDIMYEYGTKQVAKEFPWLPVEFLWDVEAGPSYGEVASIDKYLQGKQDDKQLPEEIITGEEIRTEINESLA